MPVVGDRMKILGIRSCSATIFAPVGQPNPIRRKPYDELCCLCGATLGIAPHVTEIQQFTIHDSLSLGADTSGISPSSTGLVVARAFLLSFAIKDVPL
jgi:hypothetical protein